MSELVIQTPEKFECMLQPARYKGLYGGRGSGKSHFFAEMLIEEHTMNPAQRSVGLREVQKSIQMSVRQLLVDKIQQHSLQRHFEVQDKIIKNKRGPGFIIFQGMQNHTADSIKSLEGFDRALFEEAQTASQKSLDLLRPTIRKPGSELWFAWNPSEPTDPIDALLRGDKLPPESIVQEVNYWDNPWFPDVLRAEMEYDKSRDFEKYEHIWEGKYQSMSEARVFKNWTVEEFEAPNDIEFRCGADWGFAVDPTTLIRTFIVGRTLYIDYEAYQIGCEIRDIKDLFMTVPGAEKWPIIADRSRQETISHLRNDGFRIYKADQGPGSIQDGIEFLKNYDIVVHPRCIHTIDELKSYKYKVDRLTGKVLSILEDKKNHLIDALRYACENVRKVQKARNIEKVEYSQIVIPSVSHF